MGFNHEISFFLLVGKGRGRGGSNPIILITEGQVVRAVVSVTWNVLSWSGGHKFELTQIKGGSFQSRTNLSSSIWLLDCRSNFGLMWFRWCCTGDICFLSLQLDVNSFPLFRLARWVYILCVAEAKVTIFGTWCENFTSVWNSPLQRVSYLTPFCLDSIW